MYICVLMLAQCEPPRIPTAAAASSPRHFNANAISYARTVQHKIILINGQRLAQLMIEHSIGVSTVSTIALKRVDSDYFEEG